MRERGRTSTAPGPKRGINLNALGRSRGGFSAKIHVLSDANVLPLALHLTPGQTADIAAAPDLLALGEARPREFLADKGYDADSQRAELYLRGARPIIPWKSNRKAPGTLDRCRYARRNCIERMMGLLKQFRRVATRYDKTAESFLSFVQLAAIHRWMRFVHTA
jgi:transposase